MESCQKCRGLISELKKKFKSLKIIKLIVAYVLIYFPKDIQFGKKYLIIICDKLY